MCVIGYCASFVKVEILLSPSHNSLVTLIEVLLSDHVSILADCLHSRLLANTCNVSSADLIRTAHVLLQVHVFG